MSTALYTAVYIAINGAILMEEAQCTINRESGAQPVHTVARGFAGVSPGAKQMTVSVENAIPVAGMEYDAGQVIEELVPVELGLFVGGKSLSTKGFILKDSIKHGVNAQSGYSFEFIGDYKQFE